MKDKMTDYLRRIKSKLEKIYSHSAEKRKTWDISQDYEFEAAVSFMERPSFKDMFDELTTGKQKMSEGCTGELFLKEFFNNSKKDWSEFVRFITNKKCLDIGPCVMSAIAGWDVASHRYIIEPLFPKIDRWQKHNLGQSAFEGMICYGQKADVLIPELIGKIDGAIVCRNMLDHTPMWPFILSAISSYAATGSKLLLWCDLDHGGYADDGHYDITTDIDSFKRLVNQFGFKIIREYQDKDRASINWGCFAEKTGGNIRN